MCKGKYLLMPTQGTVQSRNYDDASKLTEHVQRDRRLSAQRHTQETEIPDSQRTHATKENRNDNCHTALPTDELERWSTRYIQFPDSRSNFASVTRRTIDNKMKELHRLESPMVYCHSPKSIADCSAHTEEQRPTRQEATQLGDSSIYQESARLAI